MSEHVPLSGELLEVVDEQDRLTGRILDKNLVHQQGQWHRVAHVWITDGERLLQQRRGVNTKIMPGRWDASASGHVDPGESYLDAAQRELQEEMGLELPASRFRSFGTFKREEPVKDNAYRHRVIGNNFVVLERDLSIDALQLAAREVTNARWYPIDQLEQDLRDPRTAEQHAPHPPALYAAAITAMRSAVELG